MAEKTESYEIEFKGVEVGLKEKYRFIFSFEKFGKYHVELSEKYYSIFKPGKKYLGQFKVSGIPDFIGQEDKFANVCTVSYSLEKILEKDKVIWQK